MGVAATLPELSEWTLPIFLGRRYARSNIFGCKIFRESMFLGLNFTLCMHTPVYKYMKYLPGIPGSFRLCQLDSF